jgi:hypothetical protein
MIEVFHNLDPSKFVWLWAKYVTGLNDCHHCTNSIRGRYSKTFSKHNPDFSTQSPLLLDEAPPGTFRAIYICGVSKFGYSAKRNYIHNLHAAILPEAGARGDLEFENWRIAVRNGRFLGIPADAAELPEQYRGLPAEYTTCRIFRWAACYFSQPRG